MKIYIKSYCYSEHEPLRLINNLTENYDKITKYILYEARLYSQKFSR